MWDVELWMGVRLSVVGIVGFVVAAEQGVETFEGWFEHVLEGRFGASIRLLACPCEQPLAEGGKSREVEVVGSIGLWRSRIGHPASLCLVDFSPWAAACRPPVGCRVDPSASECQNGWSGKRRSITAGCVLVSPPPQGLKILPLKTSFS